MADQSGGNARFKGPGSQWKSSWKGKKPFNDMCCFQGFSIEPDGAYYEEPGGALDLAPGGYWLGALIHVDHALPDGVEQYIAMNSGAPGTEGWELVYNKKTSTAYEFKFRVYDGAGIAASVTTPSVFISPNVDEDIPIRIAAFFLAPTGGAPNGAIAINAENQPAFASLASPYSNPSPYLRLGVSTLDEEQSMSPPQCIYGLEGGEGDYDASDVLPVTADWYQRVKNALQLVPMPPDVAGVPVGGYTVDNGWRGNNPYLSPGVAPSPLPPFAGDTSLVYGGGTGNLTVECGPVLFAF